MSFAWQGWEADFLSDPALPNTAANRKFLEDWSAHRHSDCRNNPVDLTKRVKGSSDCQAIPHSGGLAYQAYATHDAAVHAFKQQIIFGPHDALLAAVNDGNPYKVAYYEAVAKDLEKWQSPGFVAFYVREAKAAQVAVTASHAHKGWADLQHSANKVMPESLSRVAKHNGAALRALHRARKVHL